MNGLVDSHIHLGATAAVSRSVDVSGTASVASLLEALRRCPRVERAGAASCGEGGWLRAWGYDDALLAERRHPTAAELDAVTSGRPTVLHHVTGHAAVLNGAAMNALGLTHDVAPDGLLVERQDVLAAVPRASRQSTVSAVAGVLAKLAAAGFVECTDATHTNDADALALLSEAVAQVPQVSLCAMVGVDHLDTLADFSGGLGFGDLVGGQRGGVPGGGSGGRFGGVRVGHAKVMGSAQDVTVTTTGQPVAQQVAAAHERGFPVAIHAMDIDALEVALDALTASRYVPASSSGVRFACDRIEHCALALPRQLDRIANLGVAVVTQPSFVTRREAKYREQLSDVEHEWLWPLASLLRRNIFVGFGSDAPTAPPDVEEWLAGATCRSLAQRERVTPKVARALACGHAALALELHN